MGVSRRSIIVGGMLAAASAAAIAAQPRRQTGLLKEGSLDKWIPEQLGPWTQQTGGGIVRPPDEGVEPARYAQEVSRIYAAEGLTPVMLVIAYGSTQSDTLQVHRPEFCYPAAGFSLGKAQTVTVELDGRRSVPASFFTAVRGDRVEHILYWTRLGEYFPVTWLGQHWSRVQNSFDGVIPDGVLARMSVIGGLPEPALRLLENFARQLVANTQANGQLVLLGRARAA